MQKLVIVGATGFIGSCLAQAWQPRPFVGTFYSRPRPGCVRFDAATERLADRLLLRGHGFTHAILAHGVTNLAQCARVPADSTALNVIGMLRVINDLVDAGVHPIFLSSDGVFDGTRGLRTEDQTPNPTLSYGRDKLAVETHLASLSSPWTILRLTKVISDFADPRNLLSQWIGCIDRDEIIRCATDQILTPVDLECVLRSIEFVVETSMTGLFHISGSELVSRYELLQKVIRRAPTAVRQRARIQSCLLEQIPSPEPLPRNCSLANGKFVSMSAIKPRALDEVCLTFCDTVFSLGHRRA